MIPQEEILHAVRQRLERVFPAYRHLEHLEQLASARPCFYYRQDKPQTEAAGIGTLRMRLNLDVICFGELSPGTTGSCDLQGLVEAQQQVLALFSAGYLRVGERALHMEAHPKELLSDAAAVTLSFDYFDSRPGEENQFEKMGQVELGMKLKEERKNGNAQY